MLFIRMFLANLSNSVKLPYKRLRSRPMVAAACLSHGLFSLVKSSLFGQFYQCWYHQRISTYFQRQTKGHLLLTEKATVHVLHLGRHLHVCNKASRSKYIIRIIQIKCMHLSFGLAENSKLSL